MSVLAFRYSPLLSPPNPDYVTCTNVREHAAKDIGRMREEIRRIRKRKTWVNPTGWEMNKFKLVMLTGGFYLIALISIVKGGIGASIVFATIGILLTLVYIGTERQLRNRFKDIEDRFRTRTKDQ